MTTILEHNGGFEKYLIDTANNLAASPSIEVDIITMDERFTNRVITLLQLYRFRKKALHNLQTVRDKIETNVTYYKVNTLRNLRSKLQQYDVIYSKNELLEAILFKLFLGYRTIPPVVFGCHTPIYFPQTPSLQSKIHNVLYNSFIYTYLASGVTKFHVINSEDEKRLQRLFPDKEIVKVYNPFEFDKFAQSADLHKYAQPFDKTKFNVVWVGRLTEQKGVDDLILLVNSINQSELKDAVCWNIVGDGEQSQKIEQLVKRWSNVHYFGAVQNKFISSILMQNNLFISTSKWEGFPYNLLEALAMGLPVLAYNISGCNDIVDNGTNGFLANDLQEFEETIQKIHKGEYAVHNVTEYTKSKFDAKKIYAELLDKVFNHVQ